LIYVKMSVETITTISPTTNTPILSRSGVSTSDLQEIPRVAVEAFNTWRQTSLTDRTIIVKKALDLLEKKKDQLAEELTVQMGRPIAYTGAESENIQCLCLPMITT
jgi:acyl-CoA reductase-like NAD-dependent aldehyde dehydrogenase